MLSSMRNIFKIPELRNKILFTLLMLALYRFGCPRPGARHRPRRPQGAAGAGRAGRRARVPPGLLRRRDHPVRGVRARDHAVHHGVDHHADPGGGDPQARAVAGAGRGRPAQDHAVDPLPRRRPSRCCRPRASPTCSTPAAAASARAATPPASTSSATTTTPGGSRWSCITLTAGFAAAHVVRRGHHPAGHRQRHVAPDLRLGGQPAPRQLRRGPGRVGHRRHDRASP